MPFPLNIETFVSYILTPQKMHICSLKQCNSISFTVKIQRSTHQKYDVRLQRITLWTGNSSSPTLSTASVNAPSIRSSLNTDFTWLEGWPCPLILKFGNLSFFFFFWFVSNWMWLPFRSAIKWANHLHPLIDDYDVPRMKMTSKIKDPLWIYI